MKLRFGKVIEETQIWQGNNIRTSFLKVIPNKDYQFNKIGQELFELIDIKTYTHTDRHTDTYTRVKIIPVQKQSFWDR